MKPILEVLLLYSKRLFQFFLKNYIYRITTSKMKNSLIFVTLWLILVVSKDLVSFLTIWAQNLARVYAVS
jgi:hypothetical protein